MSPPISQCTTWTEGIARTAGLAACLDRYGDTSDLKILNAFCDHMQRRIDNYRDCFSPSSRSRSPRSTSTLANIRGRRASEPGTLVLPAPQTAIARKDVAEQHALTGMAVAQGLKKEPGRPITGAKQENDDYGAALHKLLQVVATTLSDKDQALVRAVLWVCDGARISSSSTRFDIDVTILEAEMEQLEALGPKEWVEGLERGRQQRQRQA